MEEMPSPARHLRLVRTVLGSSPNHLRLPMAAAKCCAGGAATTTLPGGHGGPAHHLRLVRTVLGSPPTSHLPMAACCARNGSHGVSHGRIPFLLRTGAQIPKPEQRAAWEVTMSLRHAIRGSTGFIN